MASALELYLFALRSASPPAITWTSVNPWTAGNVNTVQQISDSQTIYAYDPNVATIYEAAAWGNGTWESQTLAFGVDIAGTNYPLTTIGAAFVSSGVSFGFYVRATIQVLTTGTGGTMLLTMDGSASDLAANRLSSNTVNLNGSDYNSGSGVTLDTYVNNTVFLTAQWGGTTTSQTLTAYGSSWTRKGR